MPSQYAAGTDVPVSRTIEEIRKLIRVSGGSAIDIIDGHDTAGLRFAMNGRSILFRCPLPSPTDRRFTHTPNTNRPRPSDKVEREIDQANRAIWRGLLLLVRAKLEAVAAGVVTFEDEFLAATVAPGTGVTVAEALRAPLTEAVRLGHSAKLLPAPGRA